MNHFKLAQPGRDDVEVKQALATRNPKRFRAANPEPNEAGEAAANPYTSTVQPNPDRKGPRTQLPYIIEVEVNCDECGGSGFDPGGIDPWESEPSLAYQGAKTQKITRNYLAEAFQIAANSESTRPIERQHLVAVIQHCRQAVSALVSLPEVA